MDAIDITSPDSPYVINDADSDQADTPGFGTELAKTFAVTTASSAGIFGGFVVIALLTPKVKTWFENRKSKTPTVDSEIVEEFKDHLKTQA